MENFRIKAQTVASSLLRPHERTSAERLDKVMREIVAYGGVHPLVVSEGFVVLDGHHRLECIKRLGVRQVPVLVVDYFGEWVSLSPRRENIPVSKELVVLRAQSGRLLPHKTTLHEYSFPLPCARIPLAAVAARH